MTHADRERMAFLGREPDADESADYSPAFERWNDELAAHEEKYRRVMAKLKKRRERINASLPNRD